MFLQKKIFNCTKCYYPINDKNKLIFDSENFICENARLQMIK